VWDEETENIKTILKEVYGFDDVDYIFTKQLDYKKFIDISKILFKYIKSEDKDDTGK
jgi:hypothetical protein